MLIFHYIRHILNAIEFHFYDSDENEQYKQDIKKVKKGYYDLLTQKREIENYIHKEIIEKEVRIDLRHVKD
jgi:hypothetical protein